MARRFHQGRYVCKNKEKYIGDCKEIIYRSSWERKVMRQLDENTSVVAWGSEPFSIPYVSPVDNKIHRYFPDFIVKAINNTVTLIEVKPFCETILPSQKGKKRERYLTELKTYYVNQAKWEAAKKMCDVKNWRFVVMTEREINP